MAPTLRTGIDRDRLAIGPVRLPPGMCQVRQERAQQGERKKKNASHNSGSPKTRIKNKKDVRCLIN